MKLPTRILISAAMFLMLIGVSAGDTNIATHIATEVIQPGKVTRVATALNHITIIELPEPVVSYSIGSDSIRVEYHDNRVLLKPTKPNVSTNLFVWTATSHSVYEILPSGDPATMSYVLDQVFPVPPPTPEPSNEEVEKQTDTMYSSALANQRLIRSGKLPHGLRF
jgi:type IV secretory pathway VirB9-like protein